MSEIKGWAIVVIFSLALCLNEWLLWGKVKEEKNKKYNYAFYIVGTIILVILISSFTYALISIPFPKANGMNRGDWLAFWGGIISCTIGGIIGGIVAYRIMKYQLGKEKLQAEKDRKEKLKMDLQVDIYKRVAVILNDFTYNIFIDNMNLELIKKNLIELLNNKELKDIIKIRDNFNSLLIALEKYEQSMIKGTELNRELGNLISNYQLVVGTSLYKKSEIVNTEFKNYNSISRQLYSNINDLIKYIANNAESIDSKLEEFISMMNIDFIGLYNKYLKISMNKLYIQLREYDYNTQKQLMQSFFDEKVEIPKVSEPFEDLEYINTEGRGVI